MLKSWGSLIAFILLVALRVFEGCGDLTRREGSACLFFCLILFLLVCYLFSTCFRP